MPYSINELLSTQITTRVVRQVAGTNRQLLRLFGVQPGGPAENPVGHRNFGYDIFNDTRTVAQGRGPMTPAGTVARQPVGRVTGTFPRFYEKLPLMAEEIHNFRAIGGPASVYDEQGARYIRAQQRYMGQRLGNTRMVQLLGMMRGNLYGHKVGDTLYYNFSSSGAAVNIDWQIPSGNKLKLNMLGGGDILAASWATASTDIPGHLRAINAAFQQLTGTSLGTVVINSVTWGYILQNDEVAAQAGTANRPYTEYVLEEGTNPDTGLRNTLIRGKIAAVPHIDFLITDEGLTVGAPGSESFVKYIPNNYAWFGPPLAGSAGEVWEQLLGSEPVCEGPGMPEVVRMGSHAWTMQNFDPAGRHLYTLDNSITALYIPAATAWGTVIY